ncbi:MULTISPECIES: type II toxin-antitoxin system RelE/ParE family toxin [unclassified Mesorhizobium]|uniref:type II toxin-antitoxin system RelE/ParE family toxin n=1 Tax=unclassified Mesorhizobium TaxID=325217 RepID=UPI00296239CA|nr:MULTISPECIES: type II toxin-antitoxin system RelE/ParE family toxin [unclassified Mesorhizobium]
MIRRLEVEYRESAKDDLTNIFRYIVESGGSPNAALRFVLRIEDHCQNIGNAPRGGRLRDDIVPGLRTVPFEHSAVIAYNRERHHSRRQHLLQWPRLRDIDARWRIEWPFLERATK